jgi:RND superfamily putative drug exporter
MARDSHRRLTMFAWLARVVTGHWPSILLGWTLAALLVYRAAPEWGSVVKDGDFAYLPPQMTSVRGESLRQKAFPDVHQKSQVVLVVARPGGALRDADYAVADQLAQALTPASEDSGPVTSVHSYQSPLLGAELVSRVGHFGQATLVMLGLRTELAAVENMGLIARVRQTVDRARRAQDFPQGLQLEITGSAAIAYDLRLAAEESLRNTQWTTIALVVFILLLVYRAPGLVIVPLLAILASSELSMGLIALLAQLSQRVAWFDFQVFRTTKIFIVVVLYGATTDYCLFLISRYREELARGLPPPQAVETALARVGPAVAASAMTTILGLGTMLFAQFGKYRYGGPTIALSLLVALAASLTLTPAMLRAGAGIIFWPFGAAAGQPPDNGSPGDRGGRFWARIGQAVVTYPGRILTASLLLLAWPAYAGSSVPTSYDMLAELRPDRFSIRGTDLLKRFFPAGETGPMTILASRDTAVFPSEQGKGQISQLTKDLYELSYRDSQGRLTRPIVGVRSLTNPLGGAPGILNPFTRAGRRNLEARGNPRATAAYLAKAPGYAGRVTRLDLITRYEPFAPEALRLLDHVQQRLVSLAGDPASPWHGTRFDFLGTTAAIRDLRTVNNRDFLHVAVMTCAVVLLVLLVLLRRPLLSLLLILSVVWGYLVSIGVTKLVFLSFSAAPPSGLSWQVPIFLFVILVAVGEDYNIYLVSRIVEEQQRRGSREGVQVALARTGGIITSCGVIMAGTFGSMIVGTLHEMHELGFALAFGVLLDTFVIRTIVVPAGLALRARPRRK